MVNETEGDKPYETFLFNCYLEIKLDKSNLIPFRYNYEFEDQPREYESYFRCLNCQASHVAGKIITKHYSMFKQKKVIPRNDIEGFKLNFDDLSGEKSIEFLERLYTKMNDFFVQNRDLSNISDKLVLEDFKYFEISKNRFSEGLELLKNNNNALKAFKLLNKTFLNNSENTYKSWRLFQIVFIVSNVTRHC